MAYRDLGQGQVVVMVHGNPTWSYYYRHLADALTEGTLVEHAFRVLVPDHVGMGRSDRWSDPKRTYTLAQRMDDFDHWLNARLAEQPSEDGRIDLVVHDWGGAIALSWAARNPEKVRRLVILNTWAFNIPSNERLPWLLRLARSRLGGWLIVRFNAFARIASWIAAKRPVKSSVRRLWVEPYRGPAKRRFATWTFVKDIPITADDPSWSVLEETHKRLSSLKDKPILIGWGMKDFVFTPKVLEIWDTIFPSAEVYRYADAGHYVLEDEQANLVPLIAQFLDGQADNEIK